jgi:hypothetical protein
MLGALQSHHLEGGGAFANSVRLGAKAPCSLRFWGSCAHHAPLGANPPGSPFWGAARAWLGADPPHLVHLGGSSANHAYLVANLAGSVHFGVQIYYTWSILGSSFAKHVHLMKKHSRLGAFWGANSPHLVHFGVQIPHTWSILGSSFAKHAHLMKKQQARSILGCESPALGPFWGANPPHSVHFGVRIPRTRSILGCSSAKHAHLPKKPAGLGAAPQHSPPGPSHPQSQSSGHPHPAPSPGG